MTTDEATTPKTGTVEVPGATLYYQVLGIGPVLLCISGGPTDAGMFGDLSRRLADRYTVVSYDQRGHSRSQLHGPPTDIAVAQHAADAAVLLEVIANEPAVVYGNSGGGTIGLELVTRRPELVGTLVAHEPPVFELLPDAAHFRRAFDEIAAAYATDGAFAAMAAFGAVVEAGGPSYSEAMAEHEPSAAEQEGMGRMVGNFDLFIAHELGPIGSYIP